jgi:hypothetical protein
MPLTCGFAARVQIGGAPSASGGIEPYAYLWTPSQGLADLDLSPLVAEPNPWLVPFDDLTYTLTVSDRIGERAGDDVSITVDRSLDHCAGFGNFASPPDWCVLDVTREDQDCNPFQLHALRCKVVMVEFADFT